MLRVLFPDNEARAQAAQLAFDLALPDAIGRSAIKPVPGAVQVLEKLRAAGCRICVVTSLPRRVLDLVLMLRGCGGESTSRLPPRTCRGGFPHQTWC